MRLCDHMFNKFFNVPHFLPFYRICDFCKNIGFCPFCLSAVVWPKNTGISGNMRGKTGVNWEFWCTNGNICISLRILRTSEYRMFSKNCCIKPAAPVCPSSSNNFQYWSISESCQHISSFGVSFWPWHNLHRRCHQHNHYKLSKISFGADVISLDVQMIDSNSAVEIAAGQKH